MILLNHLEGISARVLMPKSGSWTADVEVNLDLVPIVPTGKAILAIGVGTNVLNGTIDDRATSRVGNKATIRLVGGGGWNTPVPALHIHNDAGVLSTAVYAVTAASVGEPPVIELGPPTLFGSDHVRTQGPASRVFAGVDWWVDVLGITHTGPRPPLPPPPLADIINWHTTSKVAEIASDVLIQPGMVLVDPRFGTATVEDVEQTFDANGSTAIAWCSQPSLGAAAAALLASPPPTSGSKLVRGLGALAKEAAGVSTLKKYPYRVIVQGPDGRLNLQSTVPTNGAPIFLVMIDIWAGVPGLSCKLTPASVVLVSFIGGDPAKPVVVGFDPSNPPAIEVSLEALLINLGDETATGVATQLSMTAFMTALVTFLTASQAFYNAPAVAVLSTATAQAAAAAAAALAVTAVLPTNFSLRVRAA